MSLYTMNRHHVLDRYYILVRDLCFNRPTDDLRSRKYDSIPNISEYLKGKLIDVFILFHALISFDFTQKSISFFRLLAKQLF